MISSVAEFAPAKVNLALAVTGRRDDGYHLLDSYVVFADVGDTVRADPADGLSLDISGSFAGALDACPSNLVMRAADALRDAARRAGRRVPGARIELVKELPVAAGIGGGSADAAAALRALDRLWKLGFAPSELARVGATLGSDVAMCVRSRALRARGVGDCVAPLDGFGQVALVLVNAGRELPTAKVFAARSQGCSPALPELGDPAGPHELASRLAAMTNDLEAPARRLAPEIDVVLGALHASEGCLLARMSGSGATCFGLFPDLATAEAAARRLAAERPGWWVVSALAR